MIIDFDTATPTGRAIEHILDSALADRVGQGLDVVWRGGSARRLIIHPQTLGTDGDGSLLMLIASLAGVGQVNLAHLYGTTDADQREAVALAMFIACGYEVGAPAGKRAAS